MRSGSAGPTEDDERTFLYLAVGLVIVMVAAGVLAFLVWRSAGETSDAIAALGLPLPGCGQAHGGCRPAGAPAAGDAAYARAGAHSRPCGRYRLVLRRRRDDGGRHHDLRPVERRRRHDNGHGQLRARFGRGLGGSRSPSGRSRVWRCRRPGRGALAARFLGSSAFYAGRVSAGGGDAVTGGGVTPSIDLVPAERGEPFRLRRRAEPGEL